MKRFTVSTIVFGIGLLGFFASTEDVQAQQTKPVSLGNPAALVPNVDGNYWTSLLALRPLRSQYAASPLWRDDYFEYLAAAESFIGNDAEAIADFDAARPPAKEETDADTETRMKGCTAVDARQEILMLAAHRQAVFLNEAHHVPMDRAFTLSLLRGLYAHGFRYFAAETLSATDTGIQKRGYPTTQSGYYTREPVFGDLVRTALKLGYKVVPYEYEGPRLSDPIAAQNQRERGEAQNLYDRIFKGDPNAKVLVHAGYGHIAKMTVTIDFTPGAITSKTASGTVTLMALWFQRISKIVPLCVDQSQMQEHSAFEYENRFYQAAIATNLVPETPVVLKDKHGHYFVEPDYPTAYDLFVFHPRTLSQFGRPTWLGMDGLRQAYVLPGDLSLPPAASALVQAFCENEDPAQAIPIDQVEIKPGLNPLPALMLPPGRFRLRTVDGSGKVRREWQVKMPAESNFP